MRHKEIVLKVYTCTGSKMKKKMTRMIDTQLDFVFYVHLSMQWSNFKHNTAQIF